MLLKKLCILYLTTKIVVSDEDKNLIGTTTEDYVENLENDVWHVTHLKKTDFESHTDDDKEPLEETIKKYRRTLARDPGKLKFVDSNPLPVNKNELKLANHTQDTDKLLETLNIRVVKEVEMNVTKETLSEQAAKLDVATAKPEANVQSNATGSARRSEYMFSSVEYYDDVIKFDPKDICPSEVVMIELEQDTLRAYDVECELMIEWRSME